jgi:hypothetical protein
MPDIKIVAINSGAIVGKKKSIIATQTDKHVKQSNGFNL